METFKWITCKDVLVVCSCSSFPLKEKTFSFKVFKCKLHLYLLSQGCATQSYIRLPPVLNVLSVFFFFFLTDRQVQLERGDAAAQELINSLQVLEVMTGAMSAELKPLVRRRLRPCSLKPLLKSLS